MIHNRIPDIELEKRTRPRANDIRGCYYRDQTAIFHSKPFRRLKYKTQVFFNPNDDHICTRIEHVLHVASVSATICRGLNAHKDMEWDLNEDMAYAISLGHDLGHTPFGHAGETALAEYLGGRDKFMHEVHSYRVVEKLIDSGLGLNLTYAVKDGIICHNGERFEQAITPDFTVKNLDEIQSRRFLPSTYEGAIVRFSDKIAYLGRDIEDAIVAGFIKKNDIPDVIRRKIGDSNSNIINYLVNDLVSHSTEEAIAVSDEAHELMLTLHNFNYQHIYKHPLQIEVEKSCKRIINAIFEYLFHLHQQFDWDRHDFQGKTSHTVDTYFVDYMRNMCRFYKDEATSNGWSEDEMGMRVVADYLSGMTDRFALECMKEITLPPAVQFHHGRGEF